MDQLLPYGKYAKQTQRTRWLATQPVKVLHMGGLEETGSKKKESNSVRYSERTSVCMEQNANGRMASGTESNLRHNDNSGKAYAARLRIHVFLLRKSIS